MADRPPGVQERAVCRRASGALPVRRLTCLRNAIDCVVYSLAILLTAALTACSPQWSDPVFKNQATTPVWLEGLWVDGAGDQVVRFKARDDGFEVMYADEPFVFLGSGLVTSHDGNLFISVKLKDGRFLVSDAANVPDSLPPFTGYSVQYLDRINDDEIRLTEIDYGKLLARLGPDKRVGTDVCRKVPLLARTLQRPEEELPLGPEILCAMLDTKVVMPEGAKVSLERSRLTAELYRVKPGRSSARN